MYTYMYTLYVSQCLPKWRGELEELEDTKGPAMTKSYAEAFDLLYGQDLC